MAGGGGGGFPLWQVASLLWGVIYHAACATLYLPLAALRRRTSRDHGSLLFYEGTVYHERRIPVLHHFSYTVRYAFVPLDGFSMLPSSHLTASRARSIAGSRGPVYLLTVPPSAGYTQNPLSVYYCYNDDDEMSLSCCIAEVTNTPWGERVTFLFDPEGDMVAKPLHVSPFMDMLGSWKMKACKPGKKLSITITVQHPEFGNYFTASLSATRIEKPQTSSEMFFWMMPHKIAIGIYWQALVLLWKGVKFLQHPKYIDDNEYRVRAIHRDQENCKADPRSLPESDVCHLKASRFVPHRSYEWSEAEWPWT